MHTQEFMEISKEVENLYFKMTLDWDIESKKFKERVLELLLDTFALKKVNLVGCKMKIYVERLKNYDYLELVEQFRSQEYIDIDKCYQAMSTCKINSRKI